MLGFHLRLSYCDNAQQSIVFASLRNEPTFLFFYLTLMQAMCLIKNLFYFILVLQRAVEVMCVVPKRCNDMMNVGRLQGFEVRLLFILSDMCMSVSDSMCPWTTVLD